MFLILDCNDTIVGNPSGYRTMAAAKRVITRYYINQIYSAFDSREDMTNKMIYSIIYMPD
jgi:hypothetical protein